MKKLIKFTLAVSLLAIFAFSSNPTIVKVRDFTLEKGEELFTKATNELKESENEKVSKFGEAIE